MGDCATQLYVCQLMQALQVVHVVSARMLYTLHNMYLMIAHSLLRSNDSCPWLAVDIIRQDDSNERQMADVLKASR